MLRQFQQPVGVQRRRAVLLKEGSPFNTFGLFSGNLFDNVFCHFRCVHGPRLWPMCRQGQLLWGMFRVFLQQTTWWKAIFIYNPIIFTQSWNALLTWIKWRNADPMRNAFVKWREVGFAVKFVLHFVKAAWLAEIAAFCATKTFRPMASNALFATSRTRNAVRSQLMVSVSCFGGYGIVSNVHF